MIVTALCAEVKRISVGHWSHTNVFVLNAVAHRYKGGICLELLNHKKDSIDKPNPIWGLQFPTWARYKFVHIKY